jgi:hypothetical protein
MSIVNTSEFNAVFRHAKATLMLRSIIATRARTSPDPSWITAAEVGDACAWLLTPQGRLTAGSIVTLNQKPSTEK